MLTFEEAQEALTEIADNLPPAIFDRLNGGILLLPDTVLHPTKDNAGDLFTLGEYHVDRPGRGLGRYITVYYGSFIRLYASLPGLSFILKFTAAPTSA